MARYLLLASFLCTLPACAKSSDPGETARTFLTDVAQGRQGEALERFDPELRQVGGMVLAVGLAEQGAKASRKSGLRSVQILRTDMIDETHAKVTTRSVYGDGSTETATGKMRRIEDRWFVTT
ncbi:hypothetical protein U1737_08975 [Sphingomonas sp. LB3N6]|uniref:hypothetical protein n=1 Tax=Sphingomonas fucosidasi TaxID=3096164 RepID=UPI002FCB888E